VANDPIFSEEYQLPPSTHTEELTREQPPIEFQLEQEMKQEVRNYGTGKPHRDVIRAKIIHD
jgi:hypothetical protein